MSNKLKIKFVIYVDMTIEKRGFITHELIFGVIDTFLISRSMLNVQLIISVKYTVII